ncbi:hypothetical protein CALCODRAFT_533049 [Calocera cornea HHB12733]|uniref:Uncharacterized protein n=1 Tax=Calocera cornea HHB12733 TaxID=1353952 RepID=A0A165I8S1_9BASI|nr:hypothetical protein CALCODRAFT_533049 [Calocera cornea HHB12733]
MTVSDSTAAGPKSPIALAIASSLLIIIHTNDHLSSPNTTTILLPTTLPASKVLRSKTTTHEAEMSNTNLTQLASGDVGPHDAELAKVYARNDPVTDTDAEDLASIVDGTEGADTASNPVSAGIAGGPYDFNTLFAARLRSDTNTNAVTASSLASAGSAGSAHDFSTILAARLRSDTSLDANTASNPVSAGSAGGPYDFNTLSDVRLRDVAPGEASIRLREADLAIMAAFLKGNLDADTASHLASAGTAGGPYNFNTLLTTSTDRVYLTDERIANLQVRIDFYESFLRKVIPKFPAQGVAIQGRLAEIALMRIALDSQSAEGGTDAPPSYDPAWLDTFVPQDAATHPNPTPIHPSTPLRFIGAPKTQPILPPASVDSPPSASNTQAVVDAENDKKFSHDISVYMSSAAARKYRKERNAAFKRYHEEHNIPTLGERISQWWSSGHSQSGICV